jgi:hypothetical protein
MYARLPAEELQPRETSIRATAPLHPYIAGERSPRPVIPSCVRISSPSGSRAKGLFQHGPGMNPVSSLFTSLPAS